MTDIQLKKLIKDGCEIEVDTKAITDDCDFDFDFVITFHNIFVGSDRSSYEDVRKEMEKIIAKGY